MLEQLQSYISGYDLHNLWDYWNFLNTRLFSHLEQRYMSSVRKLEIGLLRVGLFSCFYLQKDFAGLKVSLQTSNSDYITQPVLEIRG